MDAPLQLSRYGIDAFKPDFHKCPDALKSSPLFASLGPGDILFVPGSTPHAARNIEDGIGISQNFHMLGDVVSFMESGPMGFDEIQNRKNTQTFGQVQMEPEFFALRDLFHLLSDTGYKSDWSNAPLFLDANAARDMAYERVVHHLESALTQNPKLATRIAFLSGNRLVVLAMKAVGIWDCVNVDEREQVFEKPHGFPKDEARERVHAASKRIVLGDNTSWCEKAFQEYLGAIERSISNAGKEVFEEKTLHTFPSNWPKSRYLE